MEHLPWIALGRHTAFQPELDASPAELVFGQTLIIPGDMAAFDANPETPSTSEVRDMLDVLRTAAAKPPVPTSRHSKGDRPAPHFPAEAHTATHVFVRRHKSTKQQLQPTADGPFPIVRRLGDTRLQIQVGHYASGQPRFEEVHWNRCAVAHTEPQQQDAVRVPLGRKPKQQLNPDATSFIPAKPSSSAPTTTGQQPALGPATATGKRTYAQVVSRLATSADQDAVQPATRAAQDVVQTTTHKKTARQADLQQSPLN